MRREEFEAIRNLVTGALALAASVDVVYVSLFNRRDHVIYHYDPDCHRGRARHRVITPLAALQGLEPPAQACIHCQQRGGANGRAILSDQVGNESTSITRGPARRHLSGAR